VTAPRPKRHLITIEAAAGYLDVSTRSVRRYIAQGKLRAYRVGPRLIKVDEADVDALARPIAAAGVVSA
jgi:excisionase family DNA binding protein